MTTVTQAQKDQVFEILKRILNEEFEIALESITLESKLYDDFDIDSIDAVDMIVQLKPYLNNATVRPEDFKSVRTVADVVEVVARLIAENQAQ